MAIKGLELSEKYFQAYGLPLIEKRFGPVSHRIAAGLVGDGSECFGFDDDISRDHDWGPGFCIWLEDPDYEDFGRELAQAVSELPRLFMGYGPREESPWGFGRIGVFRIPEFYRTFTGMDRLPQRLEEWLYIPENSLAACTNGRIFYDPLGTFSAWRRKLLAFYPEDVRLKKIASRCMSIAQFGQYNYPRCVKRNDDFSARYAETKCCADAMSMVFLLNKRYAPFFKWVHRAVAGLPLLGQWCGKLVDDIVHTVDLHVKIELIEQMARGLIGELKRQRLSDATGDFLLDHGPAVQQQITDGNLRGRNVWVG